MIDWFLKLEDKYQIALITSSISIITIFITIGIKDLLLPFLTEKRQFKQKKIDTFRNYAKPIIQATESFIWRLIEIFENRETYLWKDCPKNEFNIYKFNSTVYRMSAILGWLRASRKEMNYLEPENQKQYDVIDNAIKKFEFALAEGKHMELEMMLNLCKNWGIELKFNDNIQKQRLAAKCEDLVLNYVDKEDKLLAYDLSEENQILLLTEISDIICENQKIAKIKPAIIIEKRVSTIQEISLIEAYIYKDWQSAIGDLMIEEITGVSRKYDVIGYKKFEELMNTNELNNKWIKKVSALFLDLNVSIPDKYDARLEQLQKVFYACIEILEAFVNVKLGQNYISNETILIFKQKKIK